MAKKKIQTVCGCDCTGCDHHGAECPGCGAVKGKPFWTAFVGAECCPVYDCCVNEKKLPHCGKCPELVCERFTRFKDPNRSEEEMQGVLLEREKELRGRK